MLLYGHKKIKIHNAPIKNSNRLENGKREQSKTGMYLLSDNMGFRERERDRRTEKERRTQTEKERQTQKERQKQKERQTQTDKDKES